MQKQDDRLSKQRFDELAAVIYRYSGIKMPPAKKTMLEGRLRRRLRANSVQSMEAYCRLLFDEGGLDKELVHLIDVVTTNKTDFFREPQHFEFLRDRVLPDFAQQKNSSPLRVWSAACSNGAEPYTIAMVLQDFLESRRDFNYSILATDISTEMVAAARRGVFNQDMMAPVPAALRRRFVMSAVSPESRHARIHPVLRSKIAFGRLNLMDAAYDVREPMDIIFCRNVLIYFDKPTQSSVLERLCRCLKPGGYLFVGHSESVVGAGIPVTPAAASVFRKL